MLVIHTIRQPSVQVALLLDRIVVLLMDRVRVRIWVRAVDSGRPVTLMQVDIDEQDLAEAPLGAETLNGDRHIVQIAEPLGMVGERVMEPSADVESDTVSQSEANGGDAPTYHSPKGLNHLARHRQLTA
jgi:hypothetical protein